MSIDSTERPKGWELAYELAGELNDLPEAHDYWEDEMQLREILRRYGGKLDDTWHDTITLPSGWEVMWRQEFELWWPYPPQPVPRGDPGDYDVE